MSSTRQQVSIYSLSKGTKESTTNLPEVFNAPIRWDLVEFYHKNARLSKMQAQGVKKDAGHGYSAESWGPGRAVARVPRIKGGGTHASGSGAFANSCRGGHMYAPKRVWRRWTRKTNLNKRRQAVASTVAATAITALVQGRGHRVTKVPELPMVVKVDATIEKTKKATELLKALGVTEDIEASKKSKNIRAGKGKYRNRRFKIKRGPLVIHNGEEEKLKAMRNMSGVDFCNVHSLSILKLAPGGHIGRFCIWTESAFTELDKIFGTAKAASERKYMSRSWTLPKACLTDTDVEKILSSNAVYNVLDKNPKLPLCTLKRGNPLKNKKVMQSLNPALAEADSEREKKRAALTKSLDGKKKKLEGLINKRKADLLKEIKTMD